MKALWIAATLGLSASSALAADKVTLGANWLAEAEHGGYYQALVDGTYAQYGLEVTIKPGGPQANNRLLLAAGRIDFFMGASLLGAFDAVEHNIGLIVVAAHFQKDPMVLLSHPGVGFDRFEDLNQATAYITPEGRGTLYQWLKSAYGFREANVKPYTFNPQPFIADPHAIQEGYLTSEPFAISAQGHFQPNVFLLADHGYKTYSTTIEARTDLVTNHPDIVQRFVDASAIGWYHYLYGDNAKANAAIKQANPDMSDAQLAYSLAKLKEYGIVDSGDALTLGIGAMTDAQVKAFYDQMVKAGVLKADFDYRKAYTLQFVDKGVGLDQRPK